MVGGFHTSAAKVACNSLGSWTGIWKTVGWDLRANRAVGDHGFLRLFCRAKPVIQASGSFRDLGVMG